MDHFTLLSVTCSLARKPQFYRYITVGPAAVLGLLVPVLFLLPASTKEKTTYGEPRLGGREGGREEWKDGWRGGGVTLVR